MNSKSFYAHHSAWGSYSSFIMGITGKGGGFTLSDVRPPRNNIYIGYFRKGEKPRLFPFFSDNTCGIGPEAFDSINQDAVDREWKTDNVEIFTEDQFEREMTWCTDFWKSDCMNFKLITPVSVIPDPNTMDRETAKRYSAPIIIAEVEFDNTQSHKEMTGLFALQGIRRILSDCTNGLMAGGANGTEYGFAVKPEKDVQEILSWDVVRDVYRQDFLIKRLSTEGGLMFHLPPGKKQKYRIVLATYQAGSVTSNIKGQFYYTYYFSGLEDVLRFGIENMDYYIKTSEDRDTELSSAPLNEDRKFLLAHATRSYLANTEFLINDRAEPIFIVNEGEYQMINTLDLIIDQAFWEMWFTPWTVKNELEFYLKHYSYQDSIKDLSGKIKKGGISFCHDQGVANMFSPAGHSSYELSGLNGCFSYMTHEELLNWLLTACIYVFLGEDSDWAAARKDIFQKILESLVHRDQDEDGIMDSDSTRCEDGSEITTYDSLDESLGQARNNLYLGVKTWAGYVGLENIFKILGDDKNRKIASEKSGKCTKTIMKNYNEKENYIPAVFDNGNESRIIPAIEGLIYPWIMKDLDAVSENGRFGDFIKCLKSHFIEVLQPGCCLDEISGGWKLSSTSKNTWLSKIFLNQFIAEKILEIRDELADRDRIHAGWLTDACREWAVTDQIQSDTGVDLGSRLYPRLVTAFLWLNWWT